MKIAVDRIEGGFAVCVADGADGSGSGLVFTLPAALFPFPPREGDIFEFNIVPDEAEREARGARIKSKLNKLFNKGETAK